MTMTTKKPELSSADEGSLYAWPKMVRQVDAFAETRKYLVDEPLLDLIAEGLCLLADPFQPWPPSRWALLDCLDRFVRDTERDPGAWTGRCWRPPTLSATTMGKLRQINSYVGEFLNPAPEPVPERRPLESLAQLQQQGVSVHQICLILDLLDEAGKPDPAKYRAACAGEIEVPTYRLVVPASNRPTRRPHPGRLESWCADQLEFFNTTHAELVEKYLDKRDAESSRARRRREAVVEDDHEDVPSEDQHAPAAELKRGRGRPRKSVPLQTTNMG